MPVVIVAVPEEDDYVWKVSSQKIPHMTMLYLGEINDPAALSNIIDYVDHTVHNTMHRFGMSVDRRGELVGIDGSQADVLFFDQMNVDWLEDVRSNMLKNTQINAAYNLAPQYSKWTPHLTLGYSDSPANEIERDYGIGWVSFDKISVWTGDFEGPEFVLPREGGGLDVAMSDRVDEFLEHYGVKGMKWGVRKSAGSRVRTTFKKAPSKLSDSELTKRIKRMETEKKYNDLNKKDISAGRKAVEEILTDSGKRVAKTVLTGGGLLVIKAALTAKFGEEVGSAVTRRLK